MLNETQKTAIEKLGGKHWEKNGFDRYYFNVSTEYKVYFDVVKDKWVNADADLIAKYEAMVKEAEQLTKESTDKPIVKDGKIYYKGKEVVFMRSTHGDWLDMAKGLTKEEKAELLKLAYSMQDTKKFMLDEVRHAVKWNYDELMIRWHVHYNGTKLDEFYEKQVQAIVAADDGTLLSMYNTPCTGIGDAKARRKAIEALYNAVCTEHALIESGALSHEDEVENLRKMYKMDDPRPEVGKYTGKTAKETAAEHQMEIKQAYDAIEKKLEFNADGKARVDSEHNKPVLDELGIMSTLNLNSYEKSISKQDLCKGVLNMVKDFCLPHSEFNVVKRERNEHADGRSIITTYYANGEVYVVNEVTREHLLYKTNGDVQYITNDNKLNTCQKPCGGIGLIMAQAAGLC